MKEYKQVICIKNYSWDELSEEEKNLIEAACTATRYFWKRKIGTGRRYVSIYMVPVKF